MSTHAALIKEARQAINRLFSDRSVPQCVTQQDLEDLRDELLVMMEALQADIERSGE